MIDSQRHKNGIAQKLPENRTAIYVCNHMKDSRKTGKAYSQASFREINTLRLTPWF